jgi:hypothetical protein
MNLSNVDSRLRGLGSRKTKWMPGEDALLKDAVQRFGSTNWTTVAQNVPYRNGKQCRERWLNRLCPILKTERWTVQEDAVLMAEQARFGNAWAQIAPSLPGRSTTSVKNRWKWLSKRITAPAYTLVIPPVDPSQVVLVQCLDGRTILIPSLYPNLLSV